MAEATGTPKRPHTLTLDNRKSLLITGINEVTSYDGETIVATSDAGELIVHGSMLHINSFDQVSGRMSVEGAIDAVQYVNTRQKTGSFFSRLLR